MKHAAIVGIGMSARTTTAEGLELIRRADVLLGARRMTDAFAHLGKPSLCLYRPEEVARAVEESGYERFAVLVSGDVGFYSGAAGISGRLEGCEVRLVPGVSSVSYFFAKCGLPWQGAALISCHGTDGGLVDAVRRSRATFALTGGNIRALSEALCAAGFGDLPTRVGECLGTPEERISEARVSELGQGRYHPLSVLLLENGGFDPRVRTGIPDGEFLRGETPMTKAEVRAVSLARLALRPEDICYDVGCGTGSVTVELALSAYRGRVYAIDRDEAALALTGRNCAAFHVGNAATVSGCAPGAFSGLPAPDAAFIGGSGGHLEEIVAALLEKNPRVRLAVTALAVESAASAIRAMERAGLAHEVVQLSAARARPVGGLHLMMAQNPVFLISGGGA